MASLGTLGVAKPAIDLDFDWFGHTVRVAEYASDLVELEFLTAAGKISVEDTDNAAAGLGVTVAGASAAVEAVLGSIRRLIHPEDWQTFWDAAIAHGQQLEDLLAVQKAITEAIAEFPTGLRSGSTPGPQSVPSSSAAGSSSPALTQLLDADQALRAWSGRPDLQECVVLNEEHRQARAASPA